MDICGNTFLVTGGGSGLGRATVEMLAAGGANVVIADLNHDAGLQLAAALGEKVHFCPTDVTSETDVEAAIASARELGGSLQGVVQCAGIVIPHKVLGKDGTVHPLALFTKGVEVNLIGTFNVVRLAAKTMADNLPDIEGERGVIINTASIAAFDGQIGQACYAASKAGVAGMTLPLAREMARAGIRVVTIAPGVFETPMAADVSPTVRDALAQNVLFPPRLGRALEFASLVAHVLGNLMLNGEVIRLDGAVRMPPK
ncbi:NAD(P)-dependent dehydrogenase (short-subunit alcohol dehydrogenase family) [Paraburkholderia sp. RAU2J]|uniref:SDR family NAD(P)-dependent oxidoreductase n=1 Tax=Paraburkholderia sp. RAU2J TaxID=1938810 RepID=UPI000EB0E40F|nr:SDR family NAD(P)-dependent oxidoreductase [Paraburkholderia sp. RAU2J]RKT27544.1 NAD(P)-dependent dehydrogenase (short-subunit alcohol dehydrogenase family) [Paraburkholderia sp. RAU2J]